MPQRKQHPIERQNIQAWRLAAAKATSDERQDIQAWRLPQRKPVQPHSAKGEKKAIDKNVSTLEQLRAAIARHLQADRYLHTLAVEEESAALAKLFGLSEADTHRLRIAALLHDITKDQPPAKQLELCARFGIPYSESEKCAPKVFHAKTGAHLARHKFPGLVDEEICRAIAAHTTGRQGMTLFEKLLYLADYIEPTRQFPYCAALRRYFYVNISAQPDAKPALLDKTLVLSFDMTIKTLLDENKTIDIQTIKSRNYLLTGAS